MWENTRGSCPGSVCRNCVVLFLNRHGSAAPPQQAHTRGLQRSLMEQFFSGTHRNREHWLVSIYRSMSHCKEMGPPQMVRLHVDPHQCKHSTHTENALAPAGGLALCWFKCALTLFTLFPFLPIIKAVILNSFRQSDAYMCQLTIDSENGL